MDPKKICIQIYRPYQGWILSDLGLVGRAGGVGVCVGGGGGGGEGKPHYEIYYLHVCPDTY